MANTTRPQYASTSLYVGDLLPDVQETNLYEFFNSVGPVASIRVCRDSNTRKSLGYAYVNYHSIVEAERALETLNHTPIKGHPCRIMWSQRDPAARKNTLGNLFVRNLDRGVDSRSLHDTFSLFGNILSCKVVTDNQGRSKGYGFVHFESDEAAQIATERVNGMKIGSKEVFVGPFQKRGDRPNGRAENFTNVYVKSYPASWDESKLREIFSSLGGNITSLFLSTDARGRPYACINFQEPDQAKNVVTHLNGKKVNNDGILPQAAQDDDTIAAKDQDDDQDEDRDVTTKQTDEGVVVPPPAEGVVVPPPAKGVVVPSAEGVVPSADAATGGEPVFRLFVDRAQDKSERAANLRLKYNRLAGNGGGASNHMNRNKYEGVNLYIKNLADSVDDDTLRGLFQQFGTITSAKVMKDEDGHSKGFGFVCFTTPDEATKALAEMHLKLHDQKPLYVGLAEQKDRRQARLQNHFKGSNVPTVNHPRQPQSMPTPPNAVPAGFSMPYFSQPPPLGPWNHQPPPFPRPTNGGYLWKAPNNLPPGPSGIPLMTPALPAGAGLPPPVAAYARAAAAAPRRPVPAEATNKQVIGEQLFPLVQKYQPELAGKITGMMLDMDEHELRLLLDSDSELKLKIDEAIRVLEKAAAQQQQLGGHQRN